MQDGHGGTRIAVQIAGDGLPYFMASPERLDGVRRLLDAKGIEYRLDPAIHDDGQPLAVFVTVEAGADAHELQRLLDEATG